MSWFPDLGRQTMVASGDHVRAVGWLSKHHPYTQGSVPGEFVEKLLEFVELAYESSCALYFGGFGGFHTCEFCRQADGHQNFGVPAGELLFVAPAMIGHYVEDHDYLPPATFTAAVMNSPLPNTPEYQAACAGFRAIEVRRLEALSQKGDN